MELPKQIVVLSHRTLPFEGLDENTWLVVNVHRERLSLLRGQRSDVQHESHCSRFFTSITAPISVQSTTFTGGCPTYSSPE